MRLGHTLLLAFLLLVVLPIALLTTLAYLNSGRALRAEIHHRLQQDAQQLMQRIDALLFERVENLRAWRDVEVMQDAQVGDVDKRLARFLASLRQGYGGIYAELLFADGEGRVIASSDQQHIGRPLGLDAGGARAVTLGAVRVEILPLQACRVPVQHRCLPLRTTVASRFTGETLGALYTLLDWSEIEALLDHVTETRRVPPHRLHALLADGDQQVIGATPATRQLWPQDGRGRLLPLPALTADSRSLRLPGVRGDFLLGQAASTGFKHFPGLGWRVVVLEPARTALQPVHHLLSVLVLLAVLTVLVVVGVALGLARYIAAPIERLAHFSRHYDDARPPRPPPPAGVAEVRALHHALADMTARLQASRRQLVQASKLAAVGELAATLAHEVRTPLGILRSSAQLLQGDAGLSPEGREMVDFIMAETERLNRLVTLLLECGRPREAVLRPMDLNETARRSVALLEGKAEARGLALSVHPAPGTAPVAGDAEQLEQVLLNLLLNAIQMTPAGGRIRVQVAVTGQGATLTVDDSGPGVPVDERQRIFEPFVSGREGGFGLGLSIVQQILAQHGAHIAVEDGPLGGARFIIHFPPAAGPAPDRQGGNP